MYAEKITLGAAELYYGDCAEILPQLNRFDLLLTDPPYGIDHDGQKESQNNRNPKHNRKGYAFLGWDAAIPNEHVFDLLFQKSLWHILWGGNYFIERLHQPQKGWLFWDKGQRELTMSDGELAYTNLDIPLRAITINRAQLAIDGAVHPTQKPIRLMEWCISLAPSEIRTVCDPFMGSGSVGVAAMNLEKLFIGIEKEREYFDLACQRIDDAQRQYRLAI